jgi:hypothetical protein
MYPLPSDARPYGRKAMRLWKFFVYLTASITFRGQFLIADPVSSVTSPTPAALTASDKEGKVFDPKACRAAGDGVTDDTAAFARAVAAATAAHGTIQIPVRNLPRYHKRH